MGAIVKKVIIGAALIGAAFIPGVGPLLSGYLGPALFGIGSSTVLGGISQALTKPKAGSLLNDSRGRVATIRQAAAPRRVVYGQARVGGILVFANSSGVRTAPTAQVQMVIAIC